jgi:hypothetical protein
MPYVKVTNFQSLWKDDKISSKLRIRLDIWMKFYKLKKKTLDGCNILNMDENAFKWMKNGK